MKAFVFSLEKVLELREFEERQCEIELGKAIGEVTRLQQELKKTAAQRVIYTQSRYDTSNLESIRAVEHYITRLDNQKEKYITEMASAELVVEKKRKDYEEALKQRKVLTKLKEKQLIVYKKEKNKKEEQEIDDIIIEPLI
ncbi:MAG TPA: flagellar export protein FliJ [Treponemataceae bacterium]|nr:flagellar export protein FliJ [Treponemataceae bacterium]